MLFHMQVLMPNGWQSVKPSGKNEPPYAYKTRDKAVYMLKVCYPDQCRISRLSGDPDYEGKSGMHVRVLEVE